jgi:hypothetical protein
MTTAPYPPPQGLHAPYVVTLDTRQEQESRSGVAAYYAEAYSLEIAERLAKRVSPIGRPPCIWRRRDDQRGWERLVNGVAVPVDGTSAEIGPVAESA